MIFRMTNQNTNTSTLMIVPGTFNPHSGPTYYEIDSFTMRKCGEQLVGNFTLKTDTYSSTSDRMSENILKRILRHFLRKQSVKGTLQLQSTSSGKKVECNFKLTPLTQHKDVSARRAQIDGIKSDVCEWFGRRPRR